MANGSPRSPALGPKRMRRQCPLTAGETACIDLCMATKTLSVDEGAYRILARARKDAKESFSQVIKRASWDTGKPRCGGLLSRTRGLPFMPEAALDTLDDAQRKDLPPESKWTH